jgi:sensor c-di-GMP phosphodiesterase-like protein
VQRLLGFVRHCKTSRCGLASLPPFILTLLAIILYFIWVAITLFIFRIHEDRFSLERTLIKAVITNTISVNYQPIIRIRDQKIVGVEVLSRWRDQKHGDVSPELFIPLIKKIGLYKNITVILSKNPFQKLPLWR